MPVASVVGSLASTSTATWLTLMLGYFLLNEGMVASKTWNRSPERSQIVISPESEVPVVVGVEPHAARNDAPPVASRALAAVPFRKERRERLSRLTDSADDGVGA